MVNLCISCDVSNKTLHFTYLRHALDKWFIYLFILLHANLALLWSLKYLSSLNLMCIYQSTLVQAPIISHAFGIAVDTTGICTCIALALEVSLYPWVKHLQGVTWYHAPILPCTDRLQLNFALCDRVSLCAATVSTIQATHGDTPGCWPIRCTPQSISQPTFPTSCKFDCPGTCSSNSANSS